MKRSFRLLGGLLAIILLLGWGCAPKPRAVDPGRRMEEIKGVLSRVKLDPKKMTGFILINCGETVDFKSKENTSPVGLRFESWGGGKGSFNLIYAVYLDKAEAEKAFARAALGNKPLKGARKQAMISDGGLFYQKDRVVISLNGGNEKLRREIITKLP